MKRLDQCREITMTIVLDPDLEAAVREFARRQGVVPEEAALAVLRERLGAPATQVQPRDEWERIVIEAGSDCGTALSHAALSSDGLYE
jgi:hypothetical protein